MMNHTLRILILEDLPTDAELMVSELQQANLTFTSLRVETEEAFSQALQEFSPDMVLSDYSLPQYNAMEALKLVQQQCPHIPLIVVTGAINEETAVACLKGGAADYVLKDHLVGLPRAVQGAVNTRRIQIERDQAQQALQESYRALEERVKERTAELHVTNEKLNQEVEVRKKAESTLTDALQEIQKNRDDLRTILNQLQIGTVSTDANGSITFLSTTAQRLLGRSEDQVKGQLWTQSFPLSREAKTQLKKLQDLPTSQRHKVSVKVPHGPDGESFSVDIDVQDDPQHHDQKIFFLYDTTEVHDLRELLAEPVPGKRLLGKSPAMELVYRQIQDLARADSTVMINGATGTGKELVARAIHDASHRKPCPFIPVNCAGLTESLVASLLFGHRRGSFTGAIADQPGVFEAARGGTLFLDEIGDIPQSVQTSLLRVLEEWTITRVGENTSRKIDVRVITATHRNLNQEVEAGRFRADLLYRIRVARIHLPPLCDHREDIPVLARAFLRQSKAMIGKAVETISPEALVLLHKYHWPGNVRELKNAMEYAVIRATGHEVRPQDLPPELLEQLVFSREDKRLLVSLSSPLTPRSDKNRLLEVLEKTRGNRLAAAKILAVSRSTLYRWLERENIHIPTKP